MRGLIPLLAAAVMGLSAGAVHQDCGDQLFKLLPEDGDEVNTFGSSLALSGTTAIVGAPFDDNNGHGSGSAYLFDTATGEQTAKLLPDDGAQRDQFGTSVAIDGATAIVGAYWATMTREASLARRTCSQWAAIETATASPTVATSQDAILNGMADEYE